MAEFAEQKLQEMVPEFEELERLGLLTPKEIQKLIKKRRNYEYKMVKPMKKMEDFFGYTMYDSHLLDLLSIRRQKVLLMKTYHKLEISISKRVLKRLRLMSHLWPAHHTVWKFRLSFAKSRNSVEEVSLIYAEQVKFVGRDEKIWVSWAEWEVERRRNFDKARDILLARAPLYHPKSILITKEYFRLELLYLQNLKKKNIETGGGGLDEIVAENRDKVLKCAVPKAVFENALKEFDSPDICLHFYWIAHEFPFAQELRDTIFSKMIGKFPNDVHIYKLKATMIMNGYIVNENKQEVEEESTKRNVEKDEEKSTERKVEKDAKVDSIVSHVSLSAKQKLEALFILYDSAILSIGTSFIESIIEDLFNVLNQVWASEEYRHLVAQKLLQIFDANSATLTVAQFLFWIALASEKNCSEDVIKNIMERAKEKYPDCQHIQLVSLPFTAKTNQKCKLKLIESLSGNVGAEICIQLINNSKAKLQTPLIERACLHPDVTLSKNMRVKLLESLAELKDCRKHYQKYYLLPPFCTRFHISMLKKELQESPVSDEIVRRAFDAAVDQFGRNQFGLWLSYIEFERKFGNAKNVSRLQAEVEKKLNPKYLHCFIDNKFYLQSILIKKETRDSETIIVDCPEPTVEDSALEFWSRSSLPRLFENDLIISYTEEQNRVKFFDSLVQIGKNLKESVKIKIQNDGNESEAWEEILSFIIGQKVCLNSKKVNLSDIGLDKDISSFLNRVNNKNENSRSTVKLTTSILSDETKKILESSEILKPEFMQQKQLNRYYLGRNTVKRHNRKERAKDVGKGWFNMKAPEMTEEVERDLRILKMRSLLDPRTHYKRNDMKQLPKYFQMGKVIDSPLDFHSSRLTKKERKRTIAEEIMKDEDVLRYQKRKCTEIMNAQNAKRMKRRKANNEGKQRPKNKGKKGSNKTI